MLEHFHSRFHPVVCLMFLLGFGSMYVLPAWGPAAMPWLRGILALVLGLVLADGAISLILRRRRKQRISAGLGQGFEVIPIAKRLDDT